MGIAKKMGTMQLQSSIIKMSTSKKATYFKAFSFLVSALLPLIHLHNGSSFCYLILFFKKKKYAYLKHYYVGLIILNVKL